MNHQFDPLERLILVEAQILGPKKKLPLKMALDTGASRTVIRWSTLVFAGYNPEGIQERARVTMASGIAWVPKLQIRRLDALDTERDNLTVFCHEFPGSTAVDGLLGLDFLRDRRLVVDFRQGHLSLE